MLNTETPDEIDGAGGTSVMGYVQRVLNVRREEFGPASLLFLYLFLAIGCYIMGQAVGDALFLSAFPTYLPHGIIGTALIVGIFTSTYIRASHRLRLESLVVGSLLLFAVGFIGLWWLTQIGGKWAYPLIYCWVYMTGALAPAMGWTVANYSLTTREARRLFGFIGAGGSLGAPCAGFLTANLTHRSHVRPETLLIVVAIGLGFCALSVRLFFGQTRERLAAVNRTSAAAPDMPKNLLEVWAYIRASRYLLLITALVMVGCASTTIIGYQFKLIAYKNFGADKAALASFFGTFNGCLGMASFMLQMLLTGRLLRSFGIRVTLLVMPIVFLGGSAAVMLAPVLLSACILKGSQGVLRYSLDKSSTELLYLPVVPPKVKSQIKSFIDGFVWRMADGLAGVALLIFANRMKFGPGQMSWVNFIFLIGWIGIAYGVRREYLTVLRSAIERRALDPEIVATEVLDSTTADVLARSLERGGEQQVLYGLSLFDLGRQTAWHPILCRLLEHPSALVRQRALHLLADAEHKGIAPQVEKMLGDETLEVRAEALHYLVVHARKDPLDLLQTATDVPTHYLQSAMVIYLARTRDADYLEAARLILERMLCASGVTAVASRQEAARALGAIPTPSALHAGLSELLRDLNPAVVEQALLSAGRIQAGELLPLVIERLVQPRLIAAARAALAQYGDGAVGAVQNRLNDHATPIVVRKQLARALACIGSAKSTSALAASLIQGNPELRYEVIKALNKICSRDATLIPTGADVRDLLNYELTGYYRSLQILAALETQAANSPSCDKHEALVVTAVRERMEQEFERAFRLLGLLHPSRDVYNAYLGLTSQRPQLHSNALEVLEHLLAPDLYRGLTTGVDPDRTPGERLGFARRLCQTSVASRMEALQVLLRSGDPWLAACALHAIGPNRFAELDDVVAQTLPKYPGPDEICKRPIAKGATEEFAKGITMATVLDSLDHLRRATLFHEIPAQSLVRIAAAAGERNWEEHQVLYDEDTPADFMFFLLEGEVQLLRSGKISQHKSDHEMIGAFAALAGLTHTETAIALKPTRTLRIDREEFFDAMAEDFNVTRGILKALVGVATGAT